jgi:hypothetical protein
MANFLASLKKKQVPCTDFATRAEACMAVVEYIDVCYNTPCGDINRWRTCPRRSTNGRNNLDRCPLFVANSIVSHIARLGDGLKAKFDLIAGQMSWLVITELLSAPGLQP